ncbi:MAG: alpha/beta fold hydrolase, partial [Acidimicrobiales bacterium]
MIRVPVSGGSQVAVHELSLGPTDLLAVHATGLHGQVWRPVVEHLPGRFRVLALDVRGHGVSGPMPDAGPGWAELAGDLLAVVDELHLRRPLAVGHSSGASLLLLAEEQRPGTFAGFYCIEPIGSASDETVPPNPAHPLAEGARRRRDVFPS